jgi:hypothetical protein
MSTHTPAPWVFDAEREQIVAGVETVVYETNTNVADVRLILAAPHMLAVLKHIAGLKTHSEHLQVKSQPMKIDLLNTLDHAIINARIAVAAAEDEDVTA